ncbi:MAG: hypothetical protein LBI27_03830 [Clostridiales bacterium]|nr:hypothetical protein [Clostridiales bacterium]
MEEKGLLKERENERLKLVAKKLLLRGRPFEEIAEETGLPIETIKSL